MPTHPPFLNRPAPTTEAAVWFMNLDLTEVKTGVEVAALLRARLWAQTLGQTAHLLTALPNGLLHHEVGRLRAAGELDWPLEVACLFDTLQRTGAATGAPVPDSQPPEGAVAQRDARLPDGTLRWREHTNAQGSALRRDWWDTRGHWSHLQDLDAQGHSARTLFLNDRGQPVLLKRFVFERGALWCQGVWRLEPETGEPVQAFDSERDFLFWALARWLDPAQPHVLVVDQTLHYRGLGASARLAGHRLRVVAMVHNTHELPNRRGTGRVGNVFAQGLLDGTEKVDDVVVLTQAQGRDVAPLLAALPKPPRLWVIGHPAFDQPPAIAAPLANAPATPGPVVCLARFAHQKNHLGLLWVCDAVRRAEPAVRFDFYGEGPTKADVQAQVRVMGLQQQVGLHGFCTQPGRVLAQASVAVLGSRFEGFSLFCLEALAHGVPVVAFDVDYGPGELIENGVNGYLLPAGDTVGFAQAVLRLWRDADLRARMSAAAQASAARFAPQALAQRWQELLSVERNASMDKTAIATPHLDSQGPGWRDWVLANLLRGCAPLGMVEPMLQGGWTQDAAAHALDEALAFLALPGDWRAKKS